jgi:ATP-binding cassette subfamily F protein uup
MAAVNPYLQVEGLRFVVGDKELFHDISFGIAEGQRIGLIARNGVGKTSLLNIIAGKEEPEAGTVVFRRDLRVAYLEQTPSFPTEMTVMEACLWHCKEEPRRIKEYLTKLHIVDHNQPISHLSGGQLKRVALANVLCQEPDLLILDEPTNHLDLKMIEWLENYLSRSRMTLLMVTHDRYFLDRVCSVILELEDQKLYTYRGNYAYYLEKRQERIDASNAEIARASNIYRRELEWMRSTPQARSHKARYREEAFGELERKVRQRSVEQDVSLQLNSTYIGSRIFEAEYVSKTFPPREDDPSSAERVILKDFYYNFSRYEKMGIVGANGTGKSTFVKMLLGIVKPDSGRFVIGDTVRFGYFSQEDLLLPPSSPAPSSSSALPFMATSPSGSASSASPSPSSSALPPIFHHPFSTSPSSRSRVIDAVRSIAEYVDLGGGRQLSAMQFLQHFLFTPLQQQNYIYKLSGGERRRLQLCMVLMQNPNFLILDEPTNDLDIATLNILEDYLATFRGCVIVISHDRYFMDKVVDHLLVFHGDGVIQDFPGNYSQYRSSTSNSQKPKSNSPRSSRSSGSPAASSSSALPFMATSPSQNPKSKSPRSSRFPASPAASSSSALPFMATSPSQKPKSNSPRSSRSSGSPAASSSSALPFMATSPSQNPKSNSPRSSRSSGSPAASSSSALPFMATSPSKKPKSKSPRSSRSSGSPAASSSSALPFMATSPSKKSKSPRPSTLHPSPFTPPQPRRLTYKEKREMEALEAEIATLEAEKSALEADLCSGTLSVAELTEKSRRLPRLAEELSDKEMRWLELSEIEG